MTKNLYIGLMSGTSMDGIDAVLVNFSCYPFTLLGTLHCPFSAELKKELKNLTGNNSPTFAQVESMDAQLGELFGNAALKLLEKTNTLPDKVCAIGSHGQTILHNPNAFFAYTSQIGDPSRISEKTKITTIADFRRRDIAAGGQGSPLTPAFHAYAFRHTQRDRIILNLGGIANITCLPAQQKLPVWGFDTGPANTLLDAWIFQTLDKSYDEKGNWAALGQIDKELLEKLLDDPYFSLAFPKSTGPEYFNLDWLKQKLTTIKSSPASVDIQATLCELTALSITLGIAQTHYKEGEILVCGGGEKNSYLITRIQHHCPSFFLNSTRDFGLPPEWVEATAFAWLAKQTLEHKAGNIPSVTGAKRPAVLGGIYTFG